MQTLGQIKKKIYMALDVYSHNGHAADFSGNSLEDTDIRVNSAIDSVLRKIVVLTKALIKIVELAPVHNENPAYDYLPLPNDFMAVKSISKNGNKNACEEYCVCAKNLVSPTLEKGIYTLVYYAFPEKLDENTDDDKALDFDDYILDTLVVGTAMELCANLYPDDNSKYIRFATEYDERMANMYERSVKEKAFGLKTLFTPKKRGIL